MAQMIPCLKKQRLLETDQFRYHYICKPIIIKIYKSGKYESIKGK